LLVSVIGHQCCRETANGLLQTRRGQKSTGTRTVDAAQSDELVKPSRVEIGTTSRVEMQYKLSPHITYYRGFLHSTRLQYRDTRQGCVTIRGLLQHLQPHACCAFTRQVGGRSTFEVVCATCRPVAASPARAGAVRVLELGATRLARLVVIVVHAPLVGVGVRSRVGVRVKRWC